MKGGLVHIKFLWATLLVVAFSLNVKAQTTIENATGIVSFLSSQSVYVKYASTEGIAIGDTLFITEDNQLIPSLIVKNISSTSVVCTIISKAKFQLNDKAIAKRKIKTKKAKKNPKTVEYVVEDVLDTSQATTTENIKNKEDVNGRFAISGYSNFSNTPAKSSYVVNYSLNMNVIHIHNSKFSLESNLLYRQENNKWDEVKKDVFNGLKIYSLALKYQANKNTQFVLGRKINSNLTSIGSVDGLQAETRINNFYFGGVLGTRPDYINYGFNVHLLQGGAYFGHTMHTSKGYMKNTIAVVEQTNSSKIDRRFLNFQHSNSLLKNVRVFYTLEADFYQVINNVKQNNFSLTNNYLSIRYQPFRRLRLSGTYDTRKNIIYYETYKSYTNALIAQETRQGYNAQINYQLFKRFYLGVRAGYRFQKNDIRTTKNAYAFVRYTNMFKSKLSATLSSTLLATNYLNGNIYNIRFSHPFGAGKTNVSLGYSYIRYNILKAELPLIQHVANISFSKQLAKKLSFSFNFEVNKERANQFYRMYIQLRKRF